MTTQTHLDAIRLRLSRERVRLQSAKCPNEIALREVWVQQIEKELQDELDFLGIKDSLLSDLSDDELLSELMG